jgi:thiol-disulfide isomerase/thioredoxin
LLDDNADGRFDDLDSGAMIIDLNQDGKLQGRSDSAEYHKLGQPFHVHGTTLEIASLSPDGLNLTLRHSKAKVAMKSFIAAGHPAPQFTAKDLQGKTIDLQAQAKESKYILLDFWASWCGPCKKEYPYLRRLHAQYQNHGLRIIGVNLDTKLEKAIEAANDEILDYAHVFDGKGWKNEIAQLYRVRGIPATFLLDQDLKIISKGLRGSALEKRMRALLGPGDEAAAAAIEKEAQSRAKASSGGTSK